MRDKIKGRMTSPSMGTSKPKKSDKFLKDGIQQCSLSPNLSDCLMISDFAALPIFTFSYWDSTPSLLKIGLQTLHEDKFEY